jgi:hypothetical protein
MLTNDKRLPVITPSTVWHVPVAADSFHDFYGVLLNRVQRDTKIKPRFRCHADNSHQFQHLLLERMRVEMWCTSIQGLTFYRLYHLECEGKNQCAQIDKLVNNLTNAWVAPLVARTQPCRHVFRLNTSSRNFHITTSKQYVKSPSSVTASPRL